MTPTAQQGGRNLSAAGRLLFALNLRKEANHGLSFCVSRRRLRRGHPPRRQSCGRPHARHCVPYSTMLIISPARSPWGRSLRIRLQGRPFTALAAVPHHWHSRRLHDVLGVLTRHALLYERGQMGMAALYVIASVAISIAGLFAGLALVRNLREELFHLPHAEIFQERHVSVAAGVRRGQEFWSIEDRIGAGEET